MCTSHASDIFQIILRVFYVKSGNALPPDSITMHSHAESLFFRFPIEWECVCFFAVVTMNLWITELLFYSVAVATGAWPIFSAFIEKVEKSFIYCQFDGDDVCCLWPIY